MRTLQIYHGVFWHQPAHIVGNTEGLTQLRDALNRILSNAKKYLDATPVFNSDGEGYTCYIMKVNDDEVYKKLRLPYTSEDAVTGSICDGDCWPEHLVPTDEIEIMNKKVWDEYEKESLK